MGLVGQAEAGLASLEALIKGDVAKAEAVAKSVEKTVEERVAALEAAIAHLRAHLGFV